MVPRNIIVKIGKYIPAGFCVYPRSYLLWPPVIEESVTYAHWLRCRRRVSQDQRGGLQLPAFVQEKNACMLYVLKAMGGRTGKQAKTNSERNTTCKPSFCFLAATSASRNQRILSKNQRIIFYPTPLTWVLTAVGRR